MVLVASTLPSSLRVPMPGPPTPTPQKLLKARMRALLSWSLKSNAQDQKRVEILAMPVTSEPAF
jgi:hypothetical protein